MGFVILTAGAGIIAYTLTIFSQLFEHSFHIQGVVPNTDAMAALAQKNYGTETATIMVLGMLINIALARLTPLKYIFLTGHHTLYMAAMLAVILSVGGLSGGMGGGHRGGYSRCDDGHLPGYLAAVYP